MSHTTMRLAVAIALTIALVACSGSTPPASPQAPPAPAGLAEMSAHYGSYSTEAGDILVIARLGWFLDMKTSAYRTIYVEQSPDRFAIGCRFREPTPKCADLKFTSDALTVTDLAGKTTVAHRIPYTQTAVTIPTAGAQLAGTITETQGSARRGGIVIIHGSEPGERYFYDVWVGLYASLGLAVLTYDKRGNGDSTGRYPGEFPTEDALKIYADDASAALTFLAGRAEVDPARVGFHGGSQGGWTVPLAISRHGGAAFAVLVSAPATTVDQTDLWSSYSGGGASKPTQSDAEMLAAVRATHSGYDPAPALDALSVPTLWILGANDRTVPTAVCVELLSAMHKPNFKVQLVPTGHGMLVNATGCSRTTTPRSAWRRSWFRPSARGWRPSHDLLAAFSAAIALRASGDRQQGGQHATLEESVEHRPPKRLVKRPNVEQEGEHRKDRVRQRDLLPCLERLPPEHGSRWSALGLPHRPLILARRAHDRGGLRVRSRDRNWLGDAARSEAVPEDRRQRQDRRGHPDRRPSRNRLPVQLRRLRQRFADPDGPRGLGGHRAVRQPLDRAEFLCRGRVRKRNRARPARLEHARPNSRPRSRPVGQLFVHASDDRRLPYRLACPRQRGERHVARPRGRPERYTDAGRARRLSLNRW